MEHGIHCLPYFHTNGVILSVTVATMRHTDFKVSSIVGHSAKVLRTAVGYCAAYQRSAICDEFGESDGCSFLIG